MPSAALATTGSVLTATEYNYLPRGVLGYVSSTTAFSTSATHTTFQDETQLQIASVSYAANRYLRMTAKMNLYPSGGLQTILVKFIRGSTTIAQFAVQAVMLDASNASSFVIQRTFQGPSTAGTETFKVQIAASSANTAVTSYADATYAKELSIEDLGASA